MVSLIQLKIRGLSDGATAITRLVAKLQSGLNSSWRAASKAKDAQQRATVTKFWLGSTRGFINIRTPFFGPY